MNERSKAPAPLDPHALELAALYALSALGPSEMEAVERDYREVPAFWDEVRSLRDATASLAEAGPRAKPRRDLWPEIRACLEPVAAERPPARVPPAQVWKAWSSTGAPSTIVPRADVFEPTAFPGVHVRCLAVDEAADRVTMLVRMDAGSSYPAHRHGGAEECFVVQGDLEVGAEHELVAGDFQRMEAGSCHTVQSTRGGCLLLITSSRQDELLA